MNQGSPGVFVGRLAIDRTCDGLRCFAKDRQKCVAGCNTGAQSLKTCFVRPSLPSEETVSLLRSKHIESVLLIMA